MPSKITGRTESIPLSCGDIGRKHLQEESTLGRYGVESGGSVPPSRSSTLVKSPRNAWIHLDIAATTWLDDAKPWQSKGPSGIAIRTITEWVRSYTK